MNGGISTLYVHVRTTLIFIVLLGTEQSRIAVKRENLLVTIRTNNPNMDVQVGSFELIEIRIRS